MARRALNFHVSRQLENGLDTTRAYALLSRNPKTRRAVIFVHGFMGDPVETWTDFHGQVDAHQNAWWNAADLFFFSYESVKDSTAVTADKLAKFINFIFPKPNPSLFKCDTSDVPKALYDPQYDIYVRAGPNRYTELTLVGHSEGGLVLRRLIIDAVKTRWRELHNARLRLFAPALYGAMPVGWFGLLLQSESIGAWVKMWLYSGSAYQEMAQDSQILSAIRQQTETLARENRRIRSLRALILWGEKEGIVAPGEYICDTLWARLADHDHISICKPYDQFREPLEFVCQEKLNKRSS